jgi:hypothetical protein
MKSLLIYLLVGLTLCLTFCKPEEPPCVPQKPTGKIIFRNFYTRLRSGNEKYYLPCDTCGQEVDFLIETSNTKSVVTKVGGDPRPRGSKFFLRFPGLALRSGYKVVTTLKNWGDCGNSDTVTTVIERMLYIGNYSLKRLQGKRFLGHYDDGRNDTIKIDTLGYNDVIYPNIFDPGNHLLGFPNVVV